MGGKDLFEIFIGVEEKFAGKEGGRSFYDFLAINLLYANDDAFFQVRAEGAVGRAFQHTASPGNKIKLRNIVLPHVLTVYWLFAA